MSHLRHCRYEKHESIRPEAKGSTLQNLDDIPNHGKWTVEPTLVMSSLTSGLNFMEDASELFCVLDVRNGSATEEYLQEVQQSCYLYA